MLSNSPTSAIDFSGSPNSNSENGMLFKIKNASKTLSPPKIMSKAANASKKLSPRNIMSKTGKYTKKFQGLPKVMRSANLIKTSKTLSPPKNLINRFTKRIKSAPMVMNNVRKSPLTSDDVDNVKSSINNILNNANLDNEIVSVIDDYNIIRNLEKQFLFLKPDTINAIHADCIKRLKSSDENSRRASAETRASRRADRTPPISSSVRRSRRRHAHTYSPCRVRRLSSDINATLALHRRLGSV